MKIIFFSICFIKLIVFFLVIGVEQSISIIDGADANQYNAYALGENEVTPSSIWPIFLRALDTIDFYNREIIVSILFILSSLITPFVFSSLLNINAYVNKYEKYIHIQAYWCVATIIALYPSLLIFSLDIFRDSVMVFLAGVCMYSVKNFMHSVTIAQQISRMTLVILISYLVFLFRPYLGFSLFLSFLIYKIQFKSIKVPYLFAAYLFLLLAANAMGITEKILVYRGEDGFKTGGSSLGIGLLGKNPFEFILLFIDSVLLQFLGFYITSVNAFIFFAIESVFVIYCIYLIIKNRQYLTPFLRYLLLFTIIYGTIWTMGNDNLGTAIRLRILNYIVIVVVAASLHIIKKTNKQILQVHN